MKQLKKQSLLAAAICAILLPATALATTKTPFTDTEVVTGIVNPGTWITDGTSLFVTGVILSAVENTDDPRVSGTSTVSMDEIVDLTTGAMRRWGSFHIENAGGAWDGYWSGESTTSTGVATLVGSGTYQGLVSRWTWAGGPNWKGYIVENGPREVPMKLSAWRVEQLQWIGGAVLTPFTMQPTGDVGVIGKVTLMNGGGVGTHIGKFTDQSEVGLLTFSDPTTVAATALGTEIAANGDLVNWIGIFETNLQTGVAEGAVHFAGGTGRFEAAVGSFSGEITEQVDPVTGQASYSYDVTGTIRY